MNVFAVLMHLFAQAQTATEPAPDSAPDAAPVQADSPSSPDGGVGVADRVEEVTTQVADLLGTTFRDTGWMGWLMLFGGILGGFIVGHLAQVLFRSIARKLQARGWMARGSLFNYASGPLNLALITLGLAIGLTGVALEREVVAPLAARFIGLLYVVALGWFLYNLVDIVEVGIRKITADNTIIQLIRKAIRVFLLIMFALFVAENFFGADITAWIAGLGLAGLAVSLAAQGPIKNLFGSVTVVLDRPYGLGDAIKFGDYIGVVEAMGFRSTKLRTFDGHLVTIPNSKLIEDAVENITARPHVRRIVNVTITYDTPPERLMQGLEIIKRILAEPFMAETFDLVKMPPRVHFNKYNADSLNIEVVYWYQLNVAGRDWWTYNAQAQEFNMKLLRAFNEAGIEFAFPTQTLFLAGDSNRELAVRVHPIGNGSFSGDGRSHAGS